MKHIQGFLLFTGLLGAFACTTTNTGRQAAQNTAQYEWVFQSSNQPDDIAFALNERWADWVFRASHGRIRIKIVAAGSVVAHNQTLDAVGSNTIQGDITGPSYFAKKDAAFALFGDLIGAWRSPSDFLRFIYYGGGFEVANELLNAYGVELLGVSTVGSESLVSKKPLRSIADLQGLKLRAPEGMVESLFQELGALPTPMPFSQVYDALQSGRIDAADSSTFGRNQMAGLHDIAKYPIYPGWHSMPALQLTINKKIYDALPDDMQAILKISAGYWSQFFLMGNQDIERTVVQKASNTDVRAISWSPADIQAVQKIAAKLWKEKAKQTPMAQKYYETAISYLKNQGMLP